MKQPNISTMTLEERELGFLVYDFVNRFNENLENDEKVTYDDGQEILHKVLNEDEIVRSYYGKSEH